MFIINCGLDSDKEAIGSLPTLVGSLKKELKTSFVLSTLAWATLGGEPLTVKLSNYLIANSINS